ncbi:uncharacterized protein BT62DRAFT_1002863 [Guyanagaster necrorhizus]|uniref:Uncharacterized protein n=1 Tax=Guyanagaster necrorhizus TaxID=856835 RepID=A0A9P7VYI8_9AGAR|nr:uncharacterized protein BT62DRAFT_1002863 [Guyanagaster necrorhizus MCA 3950]KAG7449282.1 hypothetical protein BT62DRAFT_1002863 [Guyanagaster necrorhizus MCA 3950]
MSQGQDCRIVDSQLSRLPKINKNLFISSYIKDQKALVKAHADQGHPLLTSPHPSQVPLPQKELGGFDTPVLKPRVPKPRSIEFARQKPPKLASTTNTIDKPKQQISEKGTKKSSIPQPEHKSSKKQVSSSSSRKRKAAEVSDTEQQARLKDRREQRQVKRAIVQNKENDARSEVSDKDSIECKKGKQKRGKNKMPPGLALMHGFSATNIGKNRLTTHPPPILGVFGRGKASEKAKVTVKRADVRGIQFSEEVFLNRPANSKTMHSARCPSVSPSDNDIDNGRSLKSGPNDKHQNRREKGKTHATRPQKKDTASEIEELSALEEDSDTEMPSPDRSLKKKASESEIWDIEKSDFVLPSKSPSPISSPEIVPVVLDARRLHWTSRENQPHASSPVTSSSRSPHVLVDHILSSPSLGPSQSASQQGRHLHPVALPAICVPSKYFSSAAAPIVPSALPKVSIEPARNTIADTYRSDPQSAVVECTILDEMTANPPQRVHLHQYHHIPPVLERHVPPEILDGNQEQDNLTMDVYECDEHFLEGNAWRHSREYPAHYRFHHASIAPFLGEYEYATDLDLDYQQTLHDDAALQIEDETFEMSDGRVMEPIVSQSYIGLEHYYLDSSYGYPDDGDYWNEGYDEDLFDVFDGSDQHSLNLYEPYDISGHGYLDEFASKSLSVDDVCVDNEGGQMDESLVFQAQPSPELMAPTETSNSLEDDPLGDAHTFLEGRGLLCGFSKAFSRDFNRIEQGPTPTEAQVAKTLRGHWLPQRL